DRAGQQLAAMGLLEPGQDVLRRATSGDPRGDVARPGEGDQLTREHVLEADVVAHRGYGRNVVVQGDRRPSVIERVRRQVLGVGRGAPVAERDHSPTALEGRPYARRGALDCSHVDRRSAGGY